MVQVQLAERPFWHWHRVRGASPLLVVLSNFKLDVNVSSYLDLFSWNRLVRSCAFVYRGHHDVAMRVTEIRECGEGNETDS